MTKARTFLAAPSCERSQPHLDKCGECLRPILRRDPIFRHGQCVKQAGEGAHTAEAVCGHQLATVEALVLQ